jgi:hypothetical protein
LRSLARHVLARWVSQGLPFRTVNGVRCFDPRQVFNFMKTASLATGDPTWLASIAASRRAARLFDRGREPPAHGLHSATRFLVELRREFNLAGHRRGSLVRLRTPLPFEHRTQPEIDVSIATSLSGATFSRAPGRLEVRGELSEGPIVSVDVQTRVTSLCETVTVDPERLVPPDAADPEVALHLRPNEGLIRVTDAIVHLSREIAGDARNAWDCIRLLWRFLFEHMKLGHLNPQALSGTDPLRDLVRGGWFDCYAGSALLVALCRALNIPARMIGGCCLDPDSPALHYWVEVLLPPYGWFPVDLITWDLAGGRIDDKWSSYYFGRVDHRLKTECLPRIFVGPVGVPRPSAWYLLVERHGDTTEIAYYGLPDVLLYRDRLRVTELDEPHRTNFFYS